jgi:hypothetical protein
MKNTAASGISKAALPGFMNTTEEDIGILIF